VCLRQEKDYIALYYIKQDELLFTELKEVVLDHWECWNLGQKPSDISFIRRGSTWLGEAGKVVYIIFRRGDKYPSLIAKSVMSPKHGKIIINEAQNIMAVWDSASERFRESLPRPLDVIEIEGIPVYFEEAIPGVAFPEKVIFCLGKKKKEKIISETIDKLAVWLNDFQKCFNPSKEIIDSGVVEERILSPLELFSAKHDLSAREQRFIEELKENAGLLEGRNISLQPAHGDLWGGSVLWGLDGTMCIIDWEFFEPQGLPLLDFLYFSVHPGFVVNNKGENGLLGEFMNLFHDNYFSGLICEHLKTHAKAAGVESSEVIELLLSIILINLSLERDTRNKTEDSWRSLIRYFAKNGSLCKIIQS